MMEDIIKLTRAIRDNDDINYGTIISLQLIDDKAKQQDSLLKEAIEIIKYDLKILEGVRVQDEIKLLREQFLSKVEAMK